MKPALVYSVTIGFAATIVFIIWAANTGQNFFFFRICDAIPWGDKLAHFCLIGVMTYLLNLSLKNRRVDWGPRKWLLGSLIVFVLISLEEFSQAFLPNRTMDIADLTANYLGIYAFGWLSQTTVPKPTG